MSERLSGRAKGALALGAGLVLILMLAVVLIRRPGASPAPTLHVGDQRGTMRSLLQAAGELDHVPYRIEWATFPVGAPLVEAINAGAVDFRYVGSSTMTFGLAFGAPLKAISVWRFRGPGSGLIAGGAPRLRSVTDLRGERIALVRGSPAHLMVVQALRAAGVPLGAVTIVNLNPSDAKAALATGAIDAWATWDPYLAIAERDDHLRVLATSAQFSGEVECGVASERAVQGKRAELADFIARVRRAYRWADAHPDAVARAYAADTGLPLDIARIVRGRMKVEVLPRITDDAVAIHQAGADIYAEIGLIPRRIRIADVYDRSFALPD